MGQEVYFYDKNGRYVGHRQLKDGEAMPVNSTLISVEVPGGMEAHFVDGQWSFSALQEPEGIPFEDNKQAIRDAITNATTLDELKTALLDII